MVKNKQGCLYGLLGPKFRISVDKCFPSSWSREGTFYLGYLSPVFREEGWGEDARATFWFLPLKNKFLQLKILNTPSYHILGQWILNLISIQWSLTVFLICLSLINNDAECLFMCLFGHLDILFHDVPIFFFFIKKIFLAMQLAWF